MERESEARWETARTQLIARWEQVLEEIEARDSAGVLELANVVDEFCEEAAADRGALRVLPTATRPPGPFGHVPAETCRYCRGFQEFGGCFGTVEGINRAALAEDWPEAERIARRYLGMLRAVTLPREGRS